MGMIYALCGTSGVGKTTFLTLLEKRGLPKLWFLRRSTVRLQRPTEQVKFEYDFYSYNAFVAKLFSGDFAHVEQYSKSFYGIESRPIETTIESDNDGIIMAGIYGAKKLKYLYPENVQILYMFVDRGSSLMNPDCLNDDFFASDELRYRLRKKVAEGTIDISDKEVDDYIDKRMRLNWFELAFVNGVIRRKIAKIDLIENTRDNINACVDSFCNSLGRGRGIGIAIQTVNAIKTVLTD